MYITKTKKYFIISIALHVALVTIVLLNQPKFKQTEGEIYFELVTNEKVEQELLPIPEEKNKPEKTVQSNSLSEISTNKMDIKEPVQIRPHPLPEESLHTTKKSDQPELSYFQIDTFRIDLFELPDSLKEKQIGMQKTFHSKNFGSNRDAVDKWLNRNQNNTSTPLLGKLVQSAVNKIKESQKKPPRLNFMPDKIQLKALDIIWRQHKATQLDIYSQMDTLNTTAQELMNKMAYLEEKGLISKKIISPRNELTFVTPLSANGVEMSPTNRRNRIFEYQANIERSQVLQYLHARHYRQMQKDSTKQDLVKDLEDKIMIIGR